ncbi:MAG: hypothetical protein KY444_12910 [Gemmatimonadetes bacterium]|nr:hypothetical protein [Gemmatimonadota bacterium]
MTTEPFDHKEEPVKSRVLSMILLAASAAACAPSAPVAAPAPTAAPRAEPARADVPPVLALLSERERLSLTAAQVAALDSIARQWDVANQKLNRQLGVARGSRPPAFTLALRPGAKPTLSAIAENNRRAAEAVHQVLTPEQRQAVCAAPSPGPTSSAAVDGGKTARLTRVLGLRSGEPGRGPRASTRTQASRTWPWCEPSSGGTLARSRR